MTVRRINQLNIGSINHGIFLCISLFIHSFFDLFIHFLLFCFEMDEAPPTDRLCLPTSRSFVSRRPPPSQQCQSLPPSPGFSPPP